MQLRNVKSLQNLTIFRRLIGALQYVTNSRPDINFAVKKLSGYLNQPTVQHLQAAKNAQELRKVIKDLSGAHTRSRIMLLKGELHKTRKGGSKMAEYLAKMKTLSDNLLLAGCPISTKDLITQTLAGLDNEYNPIVVQLSDKIDLSWVDLKDALLTYESILEQLTILSTSFHAQANIATTNSKSSNNDGSSQDVNWRG